MLPKFALLYDCGASTLAKIASKQRNTTVTPPTTASLLWRSLRQASRHRLDVAAEGGAARRSAASRLVPDAGVDKAIEKIHDEVHQREEPAVEEDDGHDHRVVAPGHGLHEEPPHPGHAEDGFDEEGPGADGGE